MLCCVLLPLALRIPPGATPRLSAALSTPPSLSAPTNTERLVTGLAFTSGFSNVLTHQRFGYYANMMTGNSIALGAAFGSMRWGEVGFLIMMISSYMTGIAAFRVVDLRRARPVRAVAPAIVCLFAGADLCFSRVASRWPALLLSLGFGIINAISSERAATVTCMVTGHLQKLAIFVVDVLVSAASQTKAAIDDAQRRGARRSLRVLLTFCLGVAVGAALTGWPGPSLVLGASRQVCSVKAPSFTALGAVYGTLLLTHDRPSPQSGAEAAPIDEGEGADPTAAADAACLLDVYETECRRSSGSS